MTEQPRHSDSPEHPSGQTWANPMDAPPPFPNAGQPSAPYGPYASTPPQDPYSAAGTSPYGANPYASNPYGVQSYGGYQAPVSADERTWAILAHLAAPIASVVSAGWLSVVGPLLVWLMYKDKSAFVRRASAGAFNFVLTMWLVSVIGWILSFTVILAIIGIPMIIIGALGSIVLGIVGAVKTARGTSFTYPWQLPVLS
ncbi:MAG: DUF4870 domain-containing protein [Propioniciclava sp.]|uniref:DUF4870 domain-containing protein n=1 Tax=Propioniciclava sp. TaxID=2038686 RepID=UPI0039E39B23